MLVGEPADLRIGRHEDHRVEGHLGGIERLTERVEASSPRGRRRRPPPAALDKCHGSCGGPTEAPLNGPHDGAPVTPAAAVRIARGHRPRWPPEGEIGCAFHALHRLVLGSSAQVGGLGIAGHRATQATSHHREVVLAGSMLSPSIASSSCSSVLEIFATRRFERCEERPETMRSARTVAVSSASRSRSMCSSQSRASARTPHEAGRQPEVHATVAHFPRQLRAVEPELRGAHRLVVSENGGEVVADPHLEVAVGSVWPFGARPRPARPPRGGGQAGERRRLVHECLGDDRLEVEPLGDREGLVGGRDRLGRVAQPQVDPREVGQDAGPGRLVVDRLRFGRCRLEHLESSVDLTAIDEQLSEPSGGSERRDWIAECRYASIAPCA